MEDLITKIGQSGSQLVVIIPVLIQVFKKIPFLADLQKEIPIYQILAIGLGVAGAYSLGLSTPIITGIIVGLASGKGYDIVKSKK